MATPKLKDIQNKKNEKSPLDIPMRCSSIEHDDATLRHWHITRGIPLVEGLSRPSQSPTHSRWYRLHTKITFSDKSQQLDKQYMEDTMF